MDLTEFPCKVEDVIKCTLNFNFDNLGKVLTILNSNNKILEQKIHDLNVSLAIVQDLREQFEDFKFQNQTFNKKIDDCDRSIQAHSEKMIDIDNSLNQLSQKNYHIDTQLEDCIKITQSYDNNINNLNRLVEENIKTVEKISGVSESTCGKIDKLEQDIKIEEKKIAELENKSTENTTLIKEHVKKINETDKNIVKIIENISEVSRNVRNVPDNKNVRTNVTLESTNSNIPEANRKPKENLIALQYENTTKLIIAEINKINLSIAEHEKAITQHNGSIAEHIKALDNFAKDKEETNGKITDMITKISSLKDTITKATCESHESKIPQEVDMTRYSKEGGIADDTREMVQKAMENIRIISQNLGNKPNRDEIDKMNQFISTEIANLSEKLNESMKSLDANIRNVVGDIKPSISPFESDPTKILDSHFFEIMKKLTMEVVKSEIATIDLAPNISVKDSLQKLEVHQADIDKIFESIVDIRKNIIDNPLEENVRDLRRKLCESELNIRKIQMQLEDTIKNIEGDYKQEEQGEPLIKMKETESENRNSFVGGSVKEYIRIMSVNLKNVSDKLDKVASRQDNMNAEILGRVKKDLQIESTRILDEFKQDLKNSIARIEDQLREKVDRFGLDEFGRRFDSKMSKEINKKLDRTDLKKNNNMINRKIDSLENKISKTLVDTLIDLQMDEQPLIVKKSTNGDKCASCNQTLPGNQSYQYNSELYSTSINKYRSNKYSLKIPKEEIIVSDSEKPEKKLGISTVKQGFQLPDINTSKSTVDMRKKHMKSESIGNIPTRTEEERSIQNFNNTISEEIDKLH